MRGPEPSDVILPSRSYFVVTVLTQVINLMCIWMVRVVTQIAIPSCGKMMMSNNIATHHHINPYRTAPVNS